MRSLILLSLIINDLLKHQKSVTKNMLPESFDFLRKTSFIKKNVERSQK